MTDVAVNTCPLKYQKSRSKSAVLVHVPLDLIHQAHDGMAWIIYPIYGLYNYKVLMVQYILRGQFGFGIFFFIS